jgi:aldehyde dehydrogenase (NAD+)
MTLESIVKLQKEYSLIGIPKDIHYRKEALERLLESIEDNEPAIYDALKLDLNKCEMEANVMEVSQVKSEISYAINHLEQWARPKRVRTPISLFPSKSYVYKEPYGVSLIIAPWNYPVNLSLIPLVGAIAAGNCAIVKCSKKCLNTSRVIVSIINSTFDKRYVYAIEDALSYDEILSQDYDHIFFTGSERVGKTVMRSASSRLIPVTLELGGKCPCIIGPDADIDMAAKKIMWGKIINAGQTCVAPDYVVLPSECKEEFLVKAREHSNEMVRDPFNNDNYPKIINLHHFMRLTKYIMGEENLYGGRYDDKQLKIEPTLFPNATFDSEIMKEEIFGPLLPIISYTDVDDVIDTIKRRPKPLACYIFSSDREFVDLTVERMAYGSCCVNDCIVQLGNPRLPFGGVGASGIGKYHGQASFETFSNTKSVLMNRSGRDFEMKYPPFTDDKYARIRKFLK